MANWFDNDINHLESYKSFRKVMNECGQTLASIEHIQRGAEKAHCTATLTALPGLLTGWLPSSTI